MERIHDKEMQEFEKNHIEVVKKNAAECTVLLKKDGTFPLESAGKIALFGSGVRRTIKGGTGSGDVNVRHFVNVEEGMKNAGFEITTEEWLDGYDHVIQKAHQAFVQRMKDEAKAAGVQAVVYSLGKAMSEPEYDLPIIAEGDTAVYVLARNSGEGADRLIGAGDLSLTETEKRDILFLNKEFERFMLVLNVGGMVDLSPVKDVKNILILGQLGTPTGDVLADILLGKSYPSGKLAMTWADITSYPSTEGFGDPDDTYYKEGIYIGYRYFDTVNAEIAYPFGYGLGYTEFAMSGSGIFKADEKEVSVGVRVKNIGNYPGKEVVQVYYSAPQGKLKKPYQELAAFVKTRELLPGEETELTVCFPTISMASYDPEDASYMLEKGDYVIRVGNSSRNTHISGIVHLEEDVTTKTLKNICICSQLEEETPVLTPYSYREELEEQQNAPVIVVSGIRMEKEEISYSSDAIALQRQEVCAWEDVKSGRKSAEEFAAGLTDEELTLLCIGNYQNADEPLSIVGAAGGSVAGAAGETTGKLAAHGMDVLVMADGPAGLRISTSYKIVNGVVTANGYAFGEDMMQFFEEEELAFMMKAAQPSPEMQAAPEYYQYSIAIPIGTDIAQSWNPDISKQFGDIVGDEMERFGIQLWLAPALNIQRSPLCGRNFEYYSEDPLIGGVMAAAMTDGVQQHKGCGTTIKHFACNNQETNRYLSNSVVGERALREIYLKGFEIAVRRSQPHAVMTSYNLINGEHACNSKDLLTYVLRDEWGFRGIVMTDWLVTMGTMSNPGSKHPTGSAAGCVKAGNDITMPGTLEDKADIMKALSGEEHCYPLTRAELEVCAVRILRKIKELIGCL